MPAGKVQKSTARRPVQARSRVSVDVILEAAAQILESYGYKRATTNRIAERAGVSVGSLYQYFRNKDEVFDALIVKESRRYLDAISAAMPESSTPLFEAIRALLEAGYAHQHLIVGISQVMRHTPSTVYASRSNLIRNDVHKLIVKFLQTNNSIRSIADLELAADVILAQCEGLTFLGRISRTPAEQVEILTDVLLRYLR